MVVSQLALPRRSRVRQYEISSKSIRFSKKKFISRWNSYILSFYNRFISYIILYMSCILQTLHDYALQSDQVLYWKTTVITVRFPNGYVHPDNCSGFWCKFMVNLVCRLKSYYILYIYIWCGLKLTWGSPWESLRLTDIKQALLLCPAETFREPSWVRILLSAWPLSIVNFTLTSWEWQLSILPAFGFTQPLAECTLSFPVYIPAEYWPIILLWSY